MNIFTTSSDFWLHYIPASIICCSVGICAYVWRMAKNQAGEPNRDLSVCYKEQNLQPQVA